MSDYERKKIDLELKLFTSKNFEKPSDCRNPEQIRFYVRELCLKLEELERQFNYAPGWAYHLLSEYNAMQNTILHHEFITSYS
jgi:hypothetical protein